MLNPYTLNIQESPQYSGVLETFLALRYWFLRCLAAKVLRIQYCHESRLTQSTQAQYFLYNVHSFTYGWHILFCNILCVLSVVCFVMNVDWIIIIVFMLSMQFNIFLFV